MGVGARVFMQICHTWREFGSKEIAGKCGRIKFVGSKFKAQAISLYPRREHSSI